LGLFLFLCLLFQRFTTKVKISGREKLRKNANHIFCLWHSSVLLALTSVTPLIPSFLDRSKHAWMQHPSWYMKPIHILLRLMGVERIILGSTGHSGREASDQLVECLKRGYSTVVLPDGPNGPPFLIKRGILHMSMQSGVPIVAVQFIGSKFVEFNTWDRKKLSVPFSTIKMKFGDPIQVNSDNFDEAHTIITEALG
jgi:lysophospholipid acyltransferase (LPLAT)-like uncharacterized protein